MSEVEGVGDAGDAGVSATESVDPESQARIEAGRMEAFLVYLQEAHEDVIRAHNKLAHAEANVEACREIVRAAEEALVNLEEGRF